MIKKLLNSKSNNYFCTIAIGKKYESNFKKYTSKNFLLYCKKNDIGIFIITKDLLSKKSLYWKKPEWQKFLAPKILSLKFPDIKNLCMIDTDILINVESPNIFKFHKKNTVSVVSIRNYMPYKWDYITKKVAFLRNKYYSKKFPLDSALNISTKNLYRYHKLSPQKDEFCAGVYIVSKNNFTKLYDYFFKFKKNVQTITNGGEQTHFNYFVQKYLKINILDYRFQAQWVFEMASYYPFLYNKNYCKNLNLVSACVDSSVMNNYFLHFAGSWHEGSMWKSKKIGKFFGKIFNKKYLLYKKMKLKGTLHGRLIPNKK